MRGGGHSSLSTLGANFDVDGASSCGAKDLMVRAPEDFGTAEIGSEVRTVLDDGRSVLTLRDVRRHFQSIKSALSSPQLPDQEHMLRFFEYFDSLDRHLESLHNYCSGKINRLIVTNDDLETTDEEIAKLAGFLHEQRKTFLLMLLDLLRDPKIPFGRPDEPLLFLKMHAPEAETPRKLYMRVWSFYIESFRLILQALEVKPLLLDMSDVSFKQAYEFTYEELGTTCEELQALSNELQNNGRFAAYGKKVLQNLFWENYVDSLKQILEQNGLVG